MKKVKQQCKTCRYWVKEWYNLEGVDLPFDYTKGRGACVLTLTRNYVPYSMSLAIAYERKGRPCVLLTEPEFSCSQWKAHDRVFEPGEGSDE